MKITELIAALKHQLFEAGDLDVFIYDPHAFDNDLIELSIDHIMIENDDDPDEDDNNKQPFLAIDALQEY